MSNQNQIQNQAQNPSLYQNKRAGLLDEVRGFAIICMVVYHVLFMLSEFYEVKVPVFFDDWFDYVRDLFAGSFIFISGIVCRYSRNNIKRGAQCFFLGMAVTYVTAFAQPDFAILFGILHFLGVSMMLFGLGSAIADKVKPVTGIIICVLIMTVTWGVSDGVFGIEGVSALSVPLPDALYDAELLFPLGFNSPKTFSSGDYFPIFPWFFLFLAGTYAGVFVKDGKCPAFVYATRVPFLAVVGRYTIWIYMAHAPIAMGIIQLALLIKNK